MRSIIAALGLGLAACASVQGASDRPPPFTAPVDADAAPTAPRTYAQAVDLPAGAYRLDGRHASIVFRIRHMNLAWFTARFDTQDATLTLDSANPSNSSLTASVDANSVNTGVLNRQGERAFDRQIANALGVATTPQITFQSIRIVRTGEHTARVEGALTMNGQTRPLVLEATFDGAAVDPLRGGNQVLGFSAHGELNRSDWGVTEWSAFTGDTVQIVIEVEFVKAG